MSLNHPFGHTNHDIDCFLFFLQATRTHKVYVVKFVQHFKLHFELKNIPKEKCSVLLCYYTMKEQALCDPLADFELQLINKKKRGGRGRGGGGSEEHPAPLLLYLDSLPFNLHRLLPEIHADGGLGLVGEAPPGEAEGEAGLPHVGVPDDDDLKDPRLDAELQGGGAQVHGGCDARGGIGAAAGSAPAGSV